MKTAIIKDKHNMHSVEVYEAESIEEKVRRIVDEKEPIEDGAPLIYQPRKDGVKPEYNIRTDRWAVAIAAMDKVSTDTMNKYVKSQDDPSRMTKDTEVKKDAPDVAKDTSKEAAA